MEEKLKKVWLRGKAYWVTDEQFKAINPGQPTPGEPLMTEDEAIAICEGKGKAKGKAKDDK